MEKRYQVFISSTFTDLKDERQAVLRAILELDQMPAGMELFPAADESAWQLIKDVIDASDYYVLIIGGRYGSLDEMGLGYTEKEYDYAIESKKPVIPLLHENPDNLPRDKTETDEASWKKLKSFRSKVEKRHTCVYWASSEGLKAKVIVGLTAAMKRSPAIGWARGNLVPDESSTQEILKLRKRIDELTSELENARIEAPKGAASLSQGEDSFKLNYSYTSYRLDTSSVFFNRMDEKDVTGHKGFFLITWNEIFAVISPLMIDEAAEQNLIIPINEFIRVHEIDKVQKKHKGKQVGHFRVNGDDFQTIKIQFRALGLITKSQRQRSVKDIGTYWTLTPYGDNVMTQLRAIKKVNSKAEDAI
jgi:hypothetical protein